MGRSGGLSERLQDACRECGARIGCQWFVGTELDRQARACAKELHASRVGFALIG